MYRLSLIFIIEFAAVRMGYEFWRLLFDVSPSGAIDLFAIQSPERLEKSDQV
jgi:hypothetical protein